MSGGVSRRIRPTAVQKSYLIRGLRQPGGKLPLFDEQGQRYSDRTVRSCIEQGWAEPWFDNPLKPDWVVCRLTEAGRSVLSVPGRKAQVVTLSAHRDARKAS